MINFITKGGLVNALAPRVDVGQAGLDDALRLKDTRKAVQIIERVAQNQGIGARGRQQMNPEVDLNAPNAQGLRPIHRAARAGMSDVVQALLAAGVHVDTLGTEGNTALHLAVFDGHEGVVALLLKAGASPREENARGKTAIDLAKTDTAKALLCPLHYAASCGLLDNVADLLSKDTTGVRVNSFDPEGRSPLHRAAMSGQVNAARLLLAYGADPLLKDTSGMKPLEVAATPAPPAILGGARRGGTIKEVLEDAETLAEAAAAAARELGEGGAGGETENGLRGCGAGMTSYAEGEEVTYIRSGEEHAGVVVKVHHDDDEPYYTVRVTATGRERQTDANHLRKTSPCSDAAAGEGDGEVLGQGGEEDAAREDVAGGLETQEGDRGLVKGESEDIEVRQEETDAHSSPDLEDSCAQSQATPVLDTEGSRGTGQASMDEAGEERTTCSAVAVETSSDAQSVVSTTAGNGESWATATSLFKACAAELMKSQNSISPNSGDEMHSSPGSSSKANAAEILARAFAAIPSHQGGDLLAQRVRARKRGLGKGFEVDWEDQGVDVDLSDVEVGVGETGEMAEALGEACREMVLHALLGADRVKSLMETVGDGSGSTCV